MLRENRKTMNAELTAFLTDESKRRIHARTVAAMTRRAATLFEDGYTAAETHTGAHSRRFDVRTPQGGLYLVCVSDWRPTGGPEDAVFSSYCTCPAHGKYGTCKHRIAVEEHCREQQQCDEYEALQASAYDPREYDMRNFCDY